MWVYIDMRKNRAVVTQKNTFIVLTVISPFRKSKLTEEFSVIGMWQFCWLCGNAKVKGKQGGAY